MNQKMTRSPEETVLALVHVINGDVPRRNARYLSALLSARGACIEHLFAAYCFLLFMDHELMNGAASQSPLGGGCDGPSSRLLPMSPQGGRHRTATGA
jgi:hypothetical protein